MKRERRSYDKEFKLMAVNLCLTGKSTNDVAQDLGIRSELVRRWKRESKDFGDNSFPGNGKVSLTDDQKEIQRLNKALRESQLEAEILKKAVSIFSKSDNKSTSS